MNYYDVIFINKLILIGTKLILKNCILQFISDFCGEDGFFTRIGPGGLINMSKLYETEQVVDRIAAFHNHYVTRGPKAVHVSVNDSR